MKATNWNGSNSAKRVLQNRPITGGRKPPKGVNIMSVLAYRDPVRMALRLEVRALQKQVKRLSVELKYAMDVIRIYAETYAKEKTS